MNQDLDNVLVVEKLMDVEAVANPVNTVLLGPVQKSLFRYDASSQSNNSLIFIKDIKKSNYKFGIYVGIDDNYVNEKDAIKLKANKVNCLLSYNY